MLQTHILLRLLLLIVLILSSLLLLAAVVNAPIVSLSLAASLFPASLLLDERGVVHNAQEYELRAYAGLCSAVVAALLFSPDSFMPIGYHYPPLGCGLVSLVAIGVFLKGRQMHRRTLQGPRRNPASSGSLVSDGDRMVLMAYMQQIKDALEVIDGPVPSTINNYLRPTVIWKEERAIIDAFKNANSGQLNHLVAHAEVGRLFYKVKDHGSAGGAASGGDQLTTLPALSSPNSRTELIELLVKQRLSDLTLKSRCIILHALQAMRLTAHADSERWVQHIFEHTSVANLSRLKTRMDNSGSYSTLHRLIYTDIRDANIRESILQYFERQAVQAVHERLIKGGFTRTQRPWRKILSDVDDTLMSSGGKYPAGVDERLPRHECYPGVLEFFKQLDLGFAGPEDWNPTWEGNLGFLSARPHVYKDLAERKLYERIERMQKEKGLYSAAHVLCGSLATGAQFMFNNDMQPLANKKFENFEEYRALYPEFRHVFVGDNGQGDVRAGEMMLEKWSTSVECVYIHRVIPTEATFGFEGSETTAKWKRLGIVFFDTYIDAAIHAALKRDKVAGILGLQYAERSPLIHLKGLRRVCVASIEDFGTLKPKFASVYLKEGQRLLLNRSLTRANAILREKGLREVALLKADCEFVPGTAVTTTLGNGHIVGFRSADGIYKVELDQWARGVYAFLQLSQIFKRGEFTRGSAGSATTLKDQPLTPPIAQTFPRVSKQADQEFPIGSQVRIEGFKNPQDKKNKGLMATVCSYRPREQIYKVEVEKWHLANNKRAVAFCHASQLSHPHRKRTTSEVSASSKGVLSVFEFISLGSLTTAPEAPRAEKGGVKVPQKVDVDEGRPPSEKSEPERDSSSPGRPGQAEVGKAAPADIGWEEAKVAPEPEHSTKEVSEMRDVDDRIGVHREFDTYPQQ